MIIQRATPDDLIAYYGTRFDYDSMEAVIAVYDGVIKGVAGVCRWKDKPSIAVTDFHEDVSKKDKVRLVKHSMTLIGQLNEPVWSTCVTDNDAKFLMRLGFTYQNFVGGRAVMKWEPPCIDFLTIFNNISVDLSKYTLRQKIEIIEWLLFKTGINLADEMPLRHSIHGGIYCREVLLYKDILATGKIHLKDHLCSVDHGEVSIMTDDGMVRVRAPYKFEARAGLKKIALAHTDCIISTYHTTELTNVKEIESELLEDNDISWVDGVLCCNLLENSL